MEPRFQVVKVTGIKAYVLDTMTARKMSTDMALEKAEQLAENLNLVDKLKGAK